MIFDAIDNLVGTTTQDTLKNIGSAAMNGTENPVLDAVVDTWLSTSLSNPGAHWGAMLAAGAAQGGAKFGHATIGSAVVDTLASVSSPAILEMLKAMAELQQYLQDPNIEGIPIASPRITRTRDVELSSHAIIVQSKNNMAYHTDNATPKPMRWQVEGYLRTTLASDHLFVIKPSLMLQEQMLDSFATSRKPVWFKDDFNQFHKVQISSINTEHSTESTTTVKVSLTMQEYAPFVVANRMESIKTGVLKI